MFFTAFSPSNTIARSIEAICKDTLAWWKTLPDGDRSKKLSGPTPEQEAEMLKLLAS